MIPVEFRSAMASSTATAAGSGDLPCARREAHNGPQPSVERFACSEKQCKNSTLIESRKESPHALHPDGCQVRHSRIRLPVAGGTHPGGVRKERTFAHGRARARSQRSRWTTAGAPRRVDLVVGISVGAAPTETRRADVSALAIVVTSGMMAPRFSSLRWAPTPDLAARVLPLDGRAPRKVGHGGGTVERSGARVLPATTHVDRPRCFGLERHGRWGVPGAAFPVVAGLGDG